MAIFGINSDETPAQICSQAVEAGLEMLKKLEELNKYLKENFQMKLAIGIGIHYGEAVLGEIGHPEKMQLTAIGDSVNMASRVESACKIARESFLISEDVHTHIQDRFHFTKGYKVKLKGKTGKYKLYGCYSFPASKNTLTK